MSSRRSVVVTERMAVDGGVSPNQYVGEVTIQLRVHYPPGTELKVVQGLLREVVFETYLRLRRDLGEPSEAPPSSS